MSKKKIKWKITFEVRYDLDVVQRTKDNPKQPSIRSGQSAELTIEGKELDELMGDEEFFDLDADDQASALLYGSDEAWNIVNRLEESPQYENVDF